MELTFSNICTFSDGGQEAGVDYHWRFLPAVTILV